MLCPSHLQISVTRIFLHTSIEYAGSHYWFHIHILPATLRHYLFFHIIFFHYHVLPSAALHLYSIFLFRFSPSFPAIHQFHVQLHSPQEAVKQTLVLYKHKSHHQNHILPEKNFHGQSVEDGCMPEYWIFQ